MPTGTIPATLSKSTFAKFRSSRFFIAPFTFNSALFPLPKGRIKSDGKPIFARSSSRSISILRSPYVTPVLAALSARTLGITSRNTTPPPKAIRLALAFVVETTRAAEDGCTAEGAITPMKFVESRATGADPISALFNTSAKVTGDKLTVVEPSAATLVPATFPDIPSGKDGAVPPGISTTSPVEN